MNRMLLLSLIVSLIPDFASAASIVEPGHTGIWRSTARSGEGITVEILDANRASMAWFTYDDEGGQRWAFSLGEIVREGEDAYIAFREISTVDGGVFGLAYDPATVRVTSVGSATLRFEDCNRGVFSFDAFGQSLSLDYERLTRTMAAGCAPIHGIPGEPIKAHAGQSGVWSDPQRRGQGFQLQWMPNNQAGLGWYTFDPEGNQYWLTGVGQAEDGKIVFPNLISTRGAKFGAAFDSADVEVIQWGRVELELDCDSGNARYQSDAFGSGEQPLFLLTRSVPVGCPYVKPKLTDLYDVSVYELPIEPTVPPAVQGATSNILITQDVANDGSVAGVRKLVTPVQQRVSYRPILLRRGQTSWREAANVNVDRRLFVSTSGNRVLTSARRSSNPSSPLVETVFIQNGQQQPLSAQIYDNADLHGASENSGFVVGGVSLPTSPTENRLFAWIWDEVRGQRELPRPNSNEVWDPHAWLVANDGNVVLGSQWDFEEVPAFPGALNFTNTSVVWEGDAAPRPLRDPAGRYLGSPIGCDANCDIVWGQDSWAERSAQGFLRGASTKFWYLKRSGEVGYLDPTPPTVLGATLWRHVLLDVSADGGLVVGFYQTPDMDGTMPDGSRGYEALMWSESTGFVPLAELVGVSGELAHWPGMWAESISPSGEWILLTTGDYRERAGPGAPTLQRSALLRLTAKTVEAR